jgi:hypothetical protein
VPEYITDAWTPAEYKFHGETDARLLGVPMWTALHARRLAAYRVYQDYVDNTARRWLSPPDALDQIAGRNPEDHREYGDPSLIVKTILGAVLGNEQVINVAGAELFDPTEGATNTPEVTTAFNTQWYLREWGKRVRLGLKMIDVERDAITLGDGVYVVGWSNTQGKVWLKKYNPGFYFPVLDDEDDQEYPRKIHIAWEIPPDPLDPDPPGTLKIRRITYELVDFKDEEPSVTYPYAPDKPSRQRCILSDGIWTVDSQNVTVEDMTEARVKWLKNDDGEVKRKLDLGIDFIPVVHLPNTVAEEEHFGRSSLAEILQVLDDLAAADTDLQAASATTGTPVIAVSGATSRDTITSYGPGSVFETGDGNMTMLDTSRSLDALLKYVKDLLSRLATNSRVAEAALGRVNAAQVPSGIALALSFSPMEQMVREMRQVRDEKYPLLLKFVLRIAMVAGDIPVMAPTPEATIAFGSFLPTDRSTIVNEVTSLLTSSAISTRTAVLMLMNAGLPIDDAAHEVARIERLMTQKAMQLAQATGSYTEAARFLGIDPTAADITNPNPPPAPGVQPVKGVLSGKANASAPTPTPPSRTKPVPSGSDLGGP